MPNQRPVERFPLRRGEAFTYDPAYTAAQLGHEDALFTRCACPPVVDAAKGDGSAPDFESIGVGSRIPPANYRDAIVEL